MEHFDYKDLLQQTNSILKGNVLESCDIEEYTYINRERRKLQWLCECKNGHHFDYRNRVRYSTSDKKHAPCQGKCPRCGSPQISMWSKQLYPIRFNFIGG